MAKERLKDEFQLITEHIKQGHNFLLSGGAGSGKTYTLVQVIRWIIENYPSALIGCITYTNAAVKEITQRVNHNNLVVSTIHDFLWDNIKNYQKELCNVVVELLNTPDSGLQISDIENIPFDFFYSNRLEPVKIEYREYTNLKEGVISHDEVIIVANAMFLKYPKLCDILKSRYPFIMIDECQDTFPKVVEIMLTHLKQSNKKCLIGFFGDAMQCIYGTGIGNLDAYKFDGKKGDVYEVQKVQNRRNPQSVISLANKIRTDGLQQEPSSDVNAPNMDKVNGHIKEGQCLFIYTDKNENVLSSVRQYLTQKQGWNFNDSENTKELNLTYKLIADKAGFAILLEIHNGDPILKYVKEKIRPIVENNLSAEDTEEKTLGEILEMLKSKGIEEETYKPTKTQKYFIDSHNDLFERAKGYDFNNLIHTYVDTSQLVDDKKQSEDEESKTGSKRSPLIKHLCKIEQSIRLYQEGNISEFLKVTGYTRNRKDGLDRSIKSVADKGKLKDAIDALKNTDGMNIKDVIELADEKQIYPKDDNLINYQQRFPYIYDRVMNVQYKEFVNLYNYLEGQTPFSTQHKTKGAEYENILVILDNGRWNNYNFDKLFTAIIREDSVVSRTEKIFYVCCTRAKERLAVFYHKPSPTVITKATDMFGAENIVKL
ncbi:MAG: UvrD-helicase domain-containing protein [Bacteroidaceae bacterium]